MFSKTHILNDTDMNDIDVGVTCLAKSTPTHNASMYLSIGDLLNQSIVDLLSPYSQNHLRAEMPRRGRRTLLSQSYEYNAFRFFSIELQW